MKIMRVRQINIMGLADIFMILPNSNKIISANEKAYGNIVRAHTIYIAG